MKREQLNLFLNQNGYNLIPSNLPEYSLYYRPESQGVNVISIIDCTKYAYMTADQYDFVRGKIEELFSASNITDLHILSIIICDDWMKNKTLCLRDPFCWMLSPERDQLAIYEGQTPDFYGMRTALEQFLLSCRTGTFDATVERIPEETKQTIKKIPWAAASIVLINVIAFIVSAITGDLLYNIGDLFTPDVLFKKEYYRIISSMFLHANLEHIFSNMLILFFVGKVVEKTMGTIRFLIIYLMAGICGNITSILLEVQTKHFFHSVGASGAVFGIMGALLFLVAAHRGNFKDMNIRSVVFMVLFSLYSGFRADHINNAAHVGGLIAGFVCTWLLWLTVRKERRKNEN